MSFDHVSSFRTLDCDDSMTKVFPVINFCVWPVPTPQGGQIVVKVCRLFNPSRACWVSISGSRTGMEPLRWVAQLRS